MKKIYVVALLLIVSPCINSSLCSGGYPDFRATGIEIKGRDNLTKACGEYMDVYNANIGNIKTWQGHVEIVKETCESPAKKQLFYRLEYGVDFHLDRIADRKRSVSVWRSGVSYNSGKREPLTLIREAVLIDRNKQSSSNVVVVYKSYSYMDEVSEIARVKMASQLLLALNDDVANFFFDPMENATPLDIDGTKAIFANFDTKKIEEGYRKDGKPEERIRELIDILEKNGFPNHWKLSSGDGVLHFDSANGSLYTFDMKRGGGVVSYKSGTTHNWSCELQKVADVWIPLKIVQDSVYSDGRYRTIEMTWTNQKVN